MADVEGNRDGDNKIMNNDPPSPTETLCSKVILVFSFVLIICTFPLSLCVCLRMVQVCISIANTLIIFLKILLKFNQFHQLSDGCISLNKNYRNMSVPSFSGWVE